MTTCVFNPALQNAAKIKFAKFPEVEFAVQSFNFPGVNGLYPKQPFQTQTIHMGPTGIEYNPLVVNFIVDSGMENYMSIVKWIQQSITMEHREIFSDASVVFLNALKQPTVTATIRDVMPVAIDDLQYQIATTDPTPIMATATFAYTNYKFE